MIVASLGRPAALPPRPPRTAAAGFTVADPAARPAAAQAATPALALDAMLALQEQDADGVRDRQARQHGHALLQALAALQRALLAGDGEAAALHRLAALAGAVPAAAHPGLAAIVRSLALRAQVELARRGL